MLTLVRWTATNSEGYEAPAALAADVVVLTVHSGRLEALTIEHQAATRVLPGGLVRPDETPEQTARRVLGDKTGLHEIYLEQLATFADPGRDPRGWIPSVAHIALVPPATEPGDPKARWTGARRRRPLGFDHREILRHALERLEGKLWWSNVAVGILPGAFALSQAREVYEAIANTTYDPPTFARDLRATGLITPTGTKRSAGPGRPAALYRFQARKPQWGAGHRKRIAR